VAAERPAPLRRTPLHDLHVELGARLAAFAGYALPLQYPAGILAEHRHTRTAAALFDVSHMGLIRLDGAGAAAALEHLVPSDLLALAPGHLRYTVFTNERGGVRDDLVVANRGTHLELVVNAATRDADLAWLRGSLPAGCEVSAPEGRALLALQGPAAAVVLGDLLPAAPALGFMQVMEAEFEGAPCTVSRSGYTGEDGFEIGLPAAAAEPFARRLLAAPPVAPAGLGARDSLRLEAGLCLYGHELDVQITPVEAALEFVIGKARRHGGARAGGFPGAEPILAQLDAGAPRRRVGLRPEGRAPVREGASLADAHGGAVGRVTSGTFGPSAGGPVAMGLVAAACAAPGTRLQARVRAGTRLVEVVRLPFVPHRYQRS